MAWPTEQDVNYYNQHMAYIHITVEHILQKAQIIFKVWGTTVQYDIYKCACISRYAY
jgi:hypothetical protein